MGGNCGKKYAYKKERAEQDPGFAGEMDERAAGGHDNSLHLIIRITGPRDFRVRYRAYLAKNWPGVQEARDVIEAKEAKEIMEGKKNART